MSTATINVTIQAKLFPPTRWMLWVAGTAARFGFPVPHPLIRWIAQHSWFVRIGNGRWHWMRWRGWGWTV